MDEQLCQLIEEVCQHSVKNPKRRKAINRLLIEIQKLPGLIKSSHQDYLDVLNELWQWVNENICQKFDLSQPLVQERLRQWLNSRLYWRIRDRYRNNSSTQLPEVSLDATIGGEATTGATYLDQLPETGFNIPYRSGFDDYIARIEREQQQSIGLALERYIEEDPEGKLRNCHPKAYPDCNCQILSQRVLLKNPPDKFATVAKELNINYQTLTSHWKRNCLPLLQDIAKELGYQPSQQL
jgi:hypothetical protein